METWREEGASASSGIEHWPLPVADNSSLPSVPTCTMQSASTTHHRCHAACREMQTRQDTTREETTRGDGTPVFGQTSRDRHPANCLVPEPRLELSQVTWPAPTPSGCQASRLASVLSMMLNASYLSMLSLCLSAPKLDGLAWHSGGHLSFASATIKRVPSPRPARAARGQGTMRAAEAASRDVLCGSGWRLLQLCIMPGCCRAPICGRNSNCPRQLPNWHSIAPLSILPKNRGTACQPCTRYQVSAPDISKHGG
ncbi:hypothetical protein V8C42DRAFT_136581 [Trichoderma barbatum]